MFNIINADQDYTLIGPYRTELGVEYLAILHNYNPGQLGRVCITKGRVKIKSIKQIFEDIGRGLRSRNVVSILESQKTKRGLEVDCICLRRVDMMRLITMLRTHQVTRSEKKVNSDLRRCINSLLDMYYDE